jgi:hypothetical protein
MEKRALRPWFFGITGVLIVLTIASWPDLNLATTFFIIDLAVVAIFTILALAISPRKGGAKQTGAESEPTDLTTGRPD